MSGHASLRLGLLALGIATLAGAGCGRAYMTPTHGRAYRQSFAVQTVNPDRRTEAKAVQGLDSQEAAIISSGYRKSLSPKDESAAGEKQLLTYSPRTGLREAPMPAPSPGN